MHQIQFVDDDALPEGHDFILVQAPAGTAIFYRASAITPRTLEASWAAYRAMRTTQPMLPGTMRHIAS